MRWNSRSAQASHETSGPRRAGSGVVGLFLGVLVLRTGGLEAAIAFTMANYLYLGLFAAASKSRLKELFGTGVTDTWTLAAAATVALSMYAWMVLRMAHKHRIAVTVPGPGPARGAAGPGTVTA